MMRKIVWMFLMTALLSFSCSTDKMADSASASILGTWDLTALDIDPGTATTEEEFGQQILDELSAENCYLVTLTFNEDLSLVASDATNYLEIGVNSQGTGLEVTCPSQRDTYTTAYTYADGVLTFIDEDLQTVSVRVAIDGNVMVVAAQELGVQNFDAGGELRFTRR